MTDTNTRVLLKETPEGMITEEHFMFEEAAIPECGEGEILVKNLFLSLDPYMRSQIACRHISGNVYPGQLLNGSTISDVIESKHPDYKVGDRVLFNGGWQEYAISNGEGVTMVDKRIDPPSLALGGLGMPGMTAYAGIKYLGEAKAGDTVVVSAASGAVGSMVGQYARVLGCRVIGIAGSDDKCAWLRDVAGFADTINYKTESITDGIARTCPDGVDVYFDNVGGQMLEDVMWQLAVGARVVLCGLMAQINSPTPLPGPNPATIIKARATVRGLVVYDHYDKEAEMLDTLIPLVADGSIILQEDVSDGVKEAPAAFARLMTGGNFGKTIIKVA